MHEAMDALRVAYTGALHVPLCLGSVAVPLHNSHYNDGNNSNKDDGSRSRSATASAAATSSHRCTHKRYCYVRDGASLDEDAFYRWLYAHTYTDATQSTASTTAAAAAATTTPSAVNTSHSRTRKRTRSTAASHTRRAAHGDVHDDGKKQSDAHDDDATADNDNNADDESDNDNDEDETTQPATERDAALPVCSPSLLYALIDHVVFVLPRSFAQPRRVLYAPPFVIEDDTWAPHMVEVTLYFAAALAVAPVTLSHHVLLQPHCEIAPQLRAMTYGQSKPPTLVLLPPTTVTTTTTTTPPSSHTKDNDGHSAVADAKDAAVHASARGSNKDSSDARMVAAAAAVTQLVVSERKDSLRVVHPSVPLLRFVARVLRVARGATVSQLRRFFVEHVACAATNTTSSATAATARQSTRDDGDGDAVVMRWRLPYEEHIAAHAHERAARAQRALQTTAAALHDEQACLWRSCDTAVRDTAALVQQLNDALDAMHTACVQLADRPSLAP